MAGKQDLYEMLGLERAASQADIKKAYYKLALQWHPDRNPSPEATARFQALKRVYDVLSDPVKRQAYDRTGSLQDCEEMVHSDNFNELFAAFREATKVTEDDLDAFAVSYRGSAEERRDLLALFAQFGGDMPKVLDWLMLSRPELDSHRFLDTLQAAIAAGEAKPTREYQAWAAKVAASRKPAQDPLAPPPKRQKQRGDSSQALVAAIRGRGQAHYNGLLASLEAKYGGAGSSKAGAKAGSSKAAAGKGRAGKRGKQAAGRSSRSSGEDAPDSQATSNQGSEQENEQPEPSEAEFAAARARLEASSQAKAAAGAAAAAPGRKQRAAKAGDGKRRNG